MLSTSEWLSIKDIQAVISRYHDEAEEGPGENVEGGDEGGEGAPAPLGGGQSVMKDLIAQVPTLLTATQIREAMDEISAELEQNSEPWKLLLGPNGFKMSIAPEYADWVRLLRNDPRPQRLTQSALETLAIVAYRQPVTRAEIEAIRGVSADSAIARLSDKGLIKITGRADLPGRPLQYGTTPEFLEYVGVSSIEELPVSDVLSPNQISEWIERASNPQKFGNSDVGLPSDSPENSAQSPAQNANPEGEAGESGGQTGSQNGI